MIKNFFGLKILVSIILLAITVSIIAMFLNDTVEANNVPATTVPKAAIIDQLHDDIPNIPLQQRATELLEGAGYEVNLFTTKDITLDFYKRLPSMNYDFVMIRTHGAADENDNDSVTLFTGEKYQTDKYISEQLFGQVKKVAPLLEVAFLVNSQESEWVIVNDTYRTLSVPSKEQVVTSDEYFAITPELFDKGADGKFQGTIFVLGGCNTMRTTSMAESLIKRGASAVIGWDDTVGSADNDRILFGLVQNLIVNKMEMDKSIESLMEDLPLERMSFPSRLKYYSAVNNG